MNSIYSQKAIFLFRDDYNNNSYAPLYSYTKGQQQEVYSGPFDADEVGHSYIYIYPINIYVDYMKCREMRKRSGGIDDAENGDSKHPPRSTAITFAPAPAQCIYRSSRVGGGSGGGVSPALSRAPEMFSSRLYLFESVCAPHTHTHAARASVSTLTRRRRGWTL